VFPPRPHPSPRRLVALGLTVAAILAPTAARAEKLDRAAQDWLKDVHLLILPDEEKVFLGLKDAADRAEFQRIFWVRRDPNPATPANELRDVWEKAKKSADSLFEVPGERGSQTGCGQVFLLLGDPKEVMGRDVPRHFDSLRPVREGPRQPETWIYRSRTGDLLEFAGGELDIRMDEACRFAEGGHVLDELRRAAEARITRPQLGYQLGPDGHLARLETLRAAAGPSAGPLPADKQDFPLDAEVKLLLRSQTGEPYVAGLLRGQPGAAAAPAASAAPVRVRVEAQALDADGRVVASSDRLVTVPPGGDGAFVASFGLTLKPGHYTMRAGAFTEGDARGAVTSAPLAVPDFGSRELTMGRVLVFTSADAPSADPADAYGAFSVLHVRPRFGNVFTRKDEIEAVCVIYNAGADPAGKASLKARFSFLKDGRPVARGSEDTYATKDAVASVGPVPLSSFAPGRYAVRVDVTDAVTGKSQTQETPFEIRE
jgi:GWxTD domain-containing protein